MQVERLMRGGGSTGQRGRGGGAPSFFGALGVVTDSKDPMQWSLPTIRAVDAATRADIQIVAVAAGCLVYVWGM